jgi:ribosomal protein L7/L12
MRCPDDEKFAQYAEGKLDEDERAEFLTHLGECSGCSTLYALTYGHMDEFAGECPDEESISRLAEGNINADKREILLKHISLCKTCSAEFYILRKSQSVKTTVIRKTLKNRRFQLIALAAMITLIIGIAGVSTLDKGYSPGVDSIKNDLTASDVFHEENVVTASAPMFEIDQDAVIEAGKPYESVNSGVSDQIIAAAPSSGFVQDAVIKAQHEQEAKAAQKAERAAASLPIASPVYEVIYKGHDGDESEIIRLIQSITGADEERARIVVKSSSTVIKTCSSKEEAKKIKEELESIGAKIEIK